MKSQAPTGFVTVGVISGVKGLKGELRLHLFSGEASWSSKIQTVMLIPPNLSSNSIETKVLGLKSETKGFILRLQGIDTREAAEALKKTEVAIASSFFNSKKGESIFLGELLGYSVFDGDILLGRVIDFQTNSAQDLIVVRPDNLPRDSKEEILIPLVKDFILKTDHEKKEIRMQLPEGLTKVNHAL